MSKVTFVAPKKVTDKDEDGNDIITTKRWTRDELVTMVREGHPGLFEVTASHAAQVLIPQRHYQEVFEDIIEDALRGDTKASTKVSGKPVRTQRVGNSDGSNDAPRT